MTTGRLLPLVLGLALLPTQHSAAQPARNTTAAAPAALAASAAQRADALIGLARVAAARGDWPEAHARMTDSARLRSLTPALVEEHFWIAVRVDRGTAIELAKALAAHGRPSRDVLAQWLSLSGDTNDLDRAVSDGLAVARLAATAFPGDPRWQDERAALALRAEHDGRADLAVRAWATISEGTRLAQAGWQASFLRTSALQSTRATMAPELDRYVTAHPADVAMRHLAVEAWADAGQPARALRLMTPLLGAGATITDLRRAAALAASTSQAATSRTYLSRVRAHAAATDTDTWALADALAAARDGVALRHLVAMHPPQLDACRTRWVAVARASGDDALLIDAALGIAPDCPAYDALAAQVGAALVARGRAGDAEAWLTPLRNADRLDDDTRLVLARALEAREAWTAIDEVLRPMVTRAQLALSARNRTAADSEQTPVTRDAARRLAWAWQAQGRVVQAWDLVQRLGSPASDTNDAQAGWAALALAASDVASADVLSRRALGTARDADARVVQAGIAATQGDPAGVRRWLTPVAATLDDAGAVLLWLDALDALDGPAAALADLRRRTTTVPTNASLIARRALWAARLGDVAAGVADLAAVRTLDADLGARLAIRLALIDGDAASAWRLIDAAALDDARVAAGDEARDDWQRLRLEGALASERWAEVDRLLALPGDWLGRRERVLVRARLHRGRDRTLTAADRVALAAERTRTPASRDTAELLAADALDRHAPAEALALLGVDPAGPAADRLPTSIRALLADALLALGRPAEVLRLTGSSDEARPADLQVRRARALTALGRASDARTLLAAAARATARADLFAAWAEATPDPADRVRVLADALSHHAANAGLRLAYADALRLAGDYQAASREAERLVNADATSPEAWRQLVASQAAAGSPATIATLGRARTTLGDTHDTRLRLVEALSQAPQVSSEVFDLVEPWLADAPAADIDRAARLQAALAMTAGRWPVALEALTGLRQRHPGDTAVARLEAEATAWSGAHVAAVPLFERYLARVPDDADAWRQYARLLTWRGEATHAAAAYVRAEALTAAPEVPAEARTRLAVLRRDWPAAVAAARAWRTVEPQRLDALSDLALALEQSGEAAQAADAYAQLARWPALPETVQRTVSAYRWRQAARGTSALEVDHTEGFNGRRLLGRRETVLGGAMRLGQHGATELFGRLGDGRLEGGTLDASFTQGQAGLRAWLGRGVVIEGHLGATGISGTSAVLGGVRVEARPWSRLGLEVSTARRPFWENASTVGAGLQTWSTATRVRLLGQGQVEASVGADVATVSDGNRRGQMDATVSRQFGAGPRQFELRASTFLFGFRRESESYFSPRAFGRLDLEMGLVRWLGRGAAVRDGRFAVRARTGAGLDTTGLPTLLTSGGVMVPLGSRAALSADGRLTSSRQFRAWGAVVQVHVGRRAIR